MHQNSVMIKKKKNSLSNASKNLHTKTILKYLFYTEQHIFNQF